MFKKNIFVEIKGDSTGWVGRFQTVDGFLRIVDAALVWTTGSL